MSALTTQTKPRSSEWVSSVANTARVLQLFAGGRDTIGVSEISRQLGIGKSTAHRLVSTLADEGLLEQVRETGRYRLSIRMHDISRSIDIDQRLATAAEPLLNALHKWTGGAAQVDVRRGREVFLLGRVEAVPPIAVPGRRHGRSAWVNCSASGKVLLADMASVELDDLLWGWHLPRRTDETIIDHVTLRAELAQVREQGYATDMEECTPGVAAISAPIRTSSGPAIGALALSLPSSKLKPGTVRSYALVVRDAAAAVSRRLTPFAAVEPPAIPRLRRV